MGIERPLTAELPRADTRPVAHVLACWALYHPDQFHLATFAIAHIRTRLRSWAPDLDDGLAIEARWTCLGCSIDFIYGFAEGREYWIITRLAASGADPRSDIIRELGLVAFSPGRAELIRLPHLSDRILNCGTLPAAHGILVRGASATAFGNRLSHLSARRMTFQVHFAPPWLPSDYLRAQIPKSSSVPIAFEGRHPADNTKEFDMRNHIFVTRIFPALLRGHRPPRSDAYAPAACAAAFPGSPTAIPAATHGRGTVNDCEALFRAPPRRGGAPIAFDPVTGGRLPGGGRPLLS